MRPCFQKKIHMSPSFSEPRAPCVVLIICIGSRIADSPFHHLITILICAGNRIAESPTHHFLMICAGKRIAESPFHHLVIICLGNGIHESPFVRPSGYLPPFIRCHQKFNWPRGIIFFLASQMREIYFSRLLIIAQITFISTPHIRET